MTLEERFNLLKNRIPPKDREGLDDDFFMAQLESAKYYIMNERFPYAELKRPDDVEECYHMLQVDIALRLFNKMGAEGEIMHSEGGISRTYGNANGIQDLLDTIVPYAGVL